MKRILIIAANPVDEQSRASALDGTRSWKVFKQWLPKMGIDEFSIDVYNASDRIEKSVSKMRVSDYNLSRLKILTEEYDKIVALGNYAGGGLERVCRKAFHILPHPSGLNRILNDKKGLEERLRECKEYLCRS